MAIVNPPSWLQTTPGGVGYSAHDDRLLISSLVESGGVTSDGAYLVEQTDTPSMAVTLAAGGAFVYGDESSQQGVYHVFNDSEVTVSITTASGANPRKDLVCLVVHDQFYSGTDNFAEIVVVDGTPASSPTLPALPNNAIPLAQVYVNTSATSIVAANITDLRSPAALNSFMQVLPTGTVLPWLVAGSAPAGFVTADGSAYSRTVYANLYSKIGTTYGVGDGSTTFNVPNMRGRVMVMYDASQTEFNTLGKTGGAKTHTLVVSEMPSHSHTQNPHNHRTDATSTQDGNWMGMSGGSETGWAFANDVPYNNAVRRLELTNTTAVNQSTGGGGAHNNLQPYIVVTYIIKT